MHRLLIRHLTGLPLQAILARFLLLLFIMQQLEGLLLLCAAAEEKESQHTNSITTAAVATTLLGFLCFYKFPFCSRLLRFIIKLLHLFRCACFRCTLQLQLQRQLNFSHSNERIQREINKQQQKQHCSTVALALLIISFVVGFYSILFLFVFFFFLLKLHTNCFNSFVGTLCCRWGEGPALVTGLLLSFPFFTALNGFCRNFYCFSKFNI